MVGTKPPLLRLDLCRELVLQGAKLHHAGRDRRLRRRAGVAACGVQLGLGIAQRGAGVHQVLGEVADLLGVHAGVHALRQALRGAVGGDPVLAVAHLLRSSATRLSSHSVAWSTARCFAAYWSLM